MSPVLGVRPSTLPLDNFYTLEELANIDPDDRDCYVENILYESQIALLVGPQAAGKSYFLSQLGIHLAAGRNWTSHIKIPKPRNTLYVQTEGASFDLAERTNPYFADYPEAGERFSAWLPDALDFNHLPSRESATGVGIDQLIKLIEDLEVEVLLLDSLFSSMHGSISSDDNMNAVKATLLKIMRRFPKLAVVILHHEHRPRKDQSGEVVDEGMQSYAGSWVLAAMADQWWRMTIHKNQNGERRRFEQTKSRSADHEIEAFYLEFDPDTHKISPDASGLSQWEPMLRIFFKSNGITTHEQFNRWASSKQIHRQSRSRLIRNLVKTGAIVKDTDESGNVAYTWTGKSGA